MRDNIVTITLEDMRTNEITSMQYESYERADDAALRFCHAHSKIFIEIRNKAGLLLNWYAA